MAKPLLKDMIPRESFPRREERRVNKPEPMREPVKEKPQPEKKKENFQINSYKKRPRYMLWFVALASVVFCLFALSFLFANAKITVDPKIKKVALNSTLSATKDAGASALSFDTVVISGKEAKTIPATGQKDASISATGVVVIYNAFSSAPQPLAIDTRLEGSNGKIYKTVTKTVIPGVAKDGTPGTVEIKIYASAAGPSYNSPPLDFKIAGFKGTPKYSKIYGRSKGEISGGFIGKVGVVSQADQVSALSELKNTLRQKLLAKASGQIPSGFVLFKDAAFLSTDDVGANALPIYSKDNTATYSLSGTLTGILFDEQKLTAKIAQDNIGKYDGSPVYIPNIRDLIFSVVNTDSTNLSDVKNISFSLTGNAEIVYKVDVSKFTQDLLGKSKSEFHTILAQYPNIDSATLVLSPIWKMSIPAETKKVNVVVNYPK